MKALLLLIPFALLSCKDDPAPADSPEKENPADTIPEIKNQKTDEGIVTPQDSPNARLIPPPTPPVGGRVTPSPVPLPTEGTPKTPPIPSKYRTAVSIPGKPGYVYNPWTNNEVDVRGVSPGSLVRDPDDPDLTHKFRVP